MTKIKYIVTYRLNDKPVVSEHDSLMMATLKQIELDSQGIKSTIHLKV